MWFSFSTGTLDTLGCMTLCIFRYCSLAKRSSTLRSFSGTAAGFCASSLLPVHTKKQVTFHNPTYYSLPRQACPNMTHTKAYFYILLKCHYIYLIAGISFKMHKRCIRSFLLCELLCCEAKKMIIYLYKYTSN